MRCSVDKSAREDCGEKVAECIALLEHSREDTTGFDRSIFKGCCSAVSVYSTHGDSEERTHTEELLITAGKMGQYRSADIRQL